jgi:hypothetical protein
MTITLTEAQATYAAEMKAITDPIDALNAPFHAEIAELQAKIAANETPDYRKAKNELRRTTRQQPKAP